MAEKIYQCHTVHAEDRRRTRPVRGQEDSLRAGLLSELNSNAERGKFAEYLVSLALDCAGGTSEEWGSLRHTVGGRAGQGGGETSAYIQVWGQNASPSPHSARARRAHGTRKTTPMKKRCAAYVYVFALENCTIQDMVNPNPLDLSQWEFYVLPTSKLDERGTRQHQPPAALNV